MPCLLVGHALAAKERVQTPGQFFRPSPPFGIVRQNPKREKGSVASGDDEDVVSRSPELDECWVVKRRGSGLLDARMDPAIHVIVVTGARHGGKAEFFCAGADIKMLEKADPYFKYDEAL